MKAWLQEFAKYQQDPQQIMEFLEFGSRFYHYSLRNTQLIYQQNPNATFVQSYSAWKQMGVSVKGPKGKKVYFPKYVAGMWPNWGQIPWLRWGRLPGQP